MTIKVPKSHGQSEYKIHTIAIILSSVVCYFNALKCGLVFDDVAAIKENKDVRTRSPLMDLFLDDFWGTPIRKEESHKSYRPLCTLTFRLNYAVHGLDPFGYHLINVLLHCLVAVLFYRLCLYFLPSRASLLSSLLFSVHPIHTEAVTGVVGRAELLSAFFYLSALNFYIEKSTIKHYLGRFYGLVPVVLSLAGTLCKEQCLTVLPLCAIYELTIFKKNIRVKLWRYINSESKKTALKGTIIRVGVLGLGFVVITGFRLWVVGLKLPKFSRFDNPASVSPTYTRVSTYNFLLAFNSWLLIFPNCLCCDWTMGSVSLIEHVADFRNVATLAFYAVLTLLLVKIFTAKFTSKRDGDILIMGLSMLTLPFIPASNLLFPVGFVIAERVLYLPSMGFCILVVYGHEQLLRSNKKKMKVHMSFILLLVCFTLKTIRRNQDWATERSLFISGLMVNGRNPKLLNNYGRALENLGRHEEALGYYNRSMKMEPKDVRGYLNYGKALSFLGRFSEAENVFVKAKSLLPLANDQLPTDLRLTASHLNIFVNLAAVIARNQSRLAEADEVFREALTLRSDFTKAYISRGRLLQIMNKTEEAERMFTKAIHEEKHNADLYNNYGLMLLDSGRSNEALTYFTKALEVDPTHKNTLLNLAFFVQESRSAWAKTYALNKLEVGVQRGTPNETLYFRIGMASLANQNTLTAESWFRKAIQIKPTFKSALYNLALLLSEQNRGSEAIPVLRQLLTHHPSHIKGLLLLGDLYVNCEKQLDQAEECFVKIIKLDPKNVKASHNLCVVLLEKGDLFKAEVCFQEASVSHPEVDYITTNLNIVRSLLANYHKFTKRN